MKISRDPFGILENQPSRLKKLSAYEGKAWGIDGAPDSLIVGGQPLLLKHMGGKFKVFLLLVIIVAVGFLGRLTQLQIVHGTELRLSAEENRIRLKSVPAPRGIIFDRTGLPLVANVPDLSLIIVPGDLPHDPALMALSAQLARMLNEDAAALFQEMRSKRTRTYQPIVFRNHISYATALRIELVEQTLPGIHIAETATRKYLAGPALSHVLGYTGKLTTDEFSSLAEQHYALDDTIGKTGIEKSYESILRGTNGQQQVEVDALGKEQKMVAATEPIAGRNIFLSIDNKVQQQAQASIDAMAIKVNAPGGAVVAIDPRNGHVLALVSSPAFDNNAFTGGINQKTYSDLLADTRNPLFFRSTSAQYPPGSTIKPFIASAALQEHVISEHTTVNSTGGLSVGPWFFPDWKPGGHGITDVRKAIAWSVNTFFYTIGGGTETFTGLGVARIAAYIQKFGFGSATHIDLPSEASGFVPTPEWKERVKKERWYIGDTYHLAIGQGDLLVTPLQMANATAAIANGGTLYTPTMVNAITPSTTPPNTASPGKVITEHVIDSNDIRIVREGMRETVLTGSGKAAQSLSVPVAGKTGTAQFGSKKKTNAWFTAFAPYDNPTIAVAVVVDGGGEGTVAALPVAMGVLRAYFSQ